MSIIKSDRQTARQTEMYKRLKETDFDLYRTAIQSAEAVTINFKLPLEIAIAIESATIYCASKGKGLIP